MCVRVFARARSRSRVNPGRSRNAPFSAPPPAVLADSRCVVSRDAGYTIADSADVDTAFFCVHFAKGGCMRGDQCRFYHRIPTAEDDAALERTRDVFGRERFSTQRDDMGGGECCSVCVCVCVCAAAHRTRLLSRMPPHTTPVGSFTDNNRTLYVGGISRKPGQDVKEMIERHFSEWGEEEVRVEQRTRARARSHTRAHRTSTW